MEYYFNTHPIRSYPIRWISLKYASIFICQEKKIVDFSLIFLILRITSDPEAYRFRVNRLN